MRMDDGLLTSLYEGTFERPLWSGFLVQLQARTGAALVSLMLHHLGSRLHLSLGSDASHEALVGRLYGDGASLCIRPGRVYAIQDLLEASSGPARAQHEAVAAGQEFRDLRAIRVIVPGGQAWLICTGDRSINAATGALLNSLSGHLATALRMYLAIETERFRSSIAAEIVQRLNFGWLLLDAGCRILETTPHAEDLLGRSTALRRGRYDRLTPADTRADRELAALVRRFSEARSGRPHAINLSRDPWLGMLVAPVTDPRLSRHARAAATVYISGDQTSRADRQEQLIGAFGLRPSESRLAWAIVHGLSISQAAAELGLTVETARNYSK